MILLAWLVIIDLGLKAVSPNDEHPAIFANQGSLASLFEPDRYAAVRPGYALQIENSVGDAITVSTNQFGMRMADASLEAPPGVTRIAVMGDSISFGWGVEVEESYPYALESLLNQTGRGRFEVLNFAAPGFTTFHGLKQYERLVHRFEPDILILAFGLFDSYEARLSEREFFDILDRHGVSQPFTGVKAFLDQFSYLGSRWTSANRFNAALEFERLLQSRQASGYWTQRVAPEEFMRALGAIISHQTQLGNKAILAHLNLMNFDSLEPLQDLADHHQVPLMDVRRLFDGQGGRPERIFAFDRGLDASNYSERNSADGTSTLLFRVRAPQGMNPDNPIYIVGDHPTLGDGTPNKVRMYDDGTHGDERANDGVWSLRVTTTLDRPITYAFTRGPEGRWGADRDDYERVAKNQVHFKRVNPVPWAESVDWTSIVYDFDRIPYQEFLISNEHALPNALGHMAIARRLARVITDMDVFVPTAITQAN